jgi:hypothetical protein
LVLHVSIYHSLLSDNSRFDVSYHLDIGIEE